MSRIGKSKETESRLVVARAWGERGMGRLLMGIGTSGGDDNVLALNSGGGCESLTL